MATPFGELLHRCGISLPAAAPLVMLVEQGWVRPVARIALPEAAYHAWRDYPCLSMEGADACPNEDRWALELYAEAMSSPPPQEMRRWWVYFLDDLGDSTTQPARAHAIDPRDPHVAPSIFKHASSGREIRPWIDYFAYWQVFWIVDVLDALSASVTLTEPGVAVAARALPGMVEAAQQRIERTGKRWESRRPAFEWLSRVRTLLAATVLRERTWDEIDAALWDVVRSLGTDPEQMKRDVRDTLLVMWQERYGQLAAAAGRRQAPSFLAELLRQEIQYAVFAIERLTGQRADFLDPLWYDARHTNEWSDLIEALPLEEEIARRDFPRDAEMYLRNLVAHIPAADLPFNEATLRALMDTHWRANRPLRRFALAFDRLHRELGGQRLLAAEQFVPAAERIEQFLLVVLHSERVLSHVHRERTARANFPDVRPLAKDAINHALGHFGLHGGGIGAAAQKRASDLMKDRAQLHELDPQAGLQLVRADEVGSGSPLADHLVAALVNLVIVRNYAAHHDALDAELIYPADGHPEDHLGHQAMTSILLAVLLTLKAS